MMKFKMKRVGLLKHQETGILPLFSSQETSLKPINNLVPSPYGEFDPLVGYSPVPNLELENSNTLALVQLNSNDGGLISKLSEQFSFSILDRISTNVWIIKSSETNELSRLYEDSSVRWFSYLPTGWKLHPILNSIGNYDSLTILALLSSDLDIHQIENFQKN